MLLHLECHLFEKRTSFNCSLFRALLSSTFMTMLSIDEEAFRGAWSRFRGMQGLRFTDCSSFAVMERHGITHAFTFDRQFRETGFKTLP